MGILYVEPYMIVLITNTMWRSWILEWGGFINRMSFGWHNWWNSFCDHKEKIGWFFFYYLHAIKNVLLKLTLFSIRNNEIVQFITYRRFPANKFSRNLVILLNMERKWKVMVCLPASQKKTLSLIRHYLFFPICCT